VGNMPEDKSVNMMGAQVGGGARVLWCSALFFTALMNTATRDGNCPYEMASREGFSEVQVVTGRRWDGL
jgi:hypothetical protein